MSISQKYQGEREKVGIGEEVEVVAQKTYTSRLLEKGNI